MSQTEKNRVIIPLDLDLKSREGREELREIIKAELKNYNGQEILAFACRLALRTAWDLEKKKVKNIEKCNGLIILEGFIAYNPPKLG